MTPQSSGSDVLPTNSMVKEILVYYFIGLDLSRLGSLAIEPLLKKFKVVQYTAYPSYVKAAKADKKIDTLSEMNNVSVKSPQNS